MTQQIINVGTVAGDGTGDPLRTGLQKANANFTENYSAIATITATITAYGTVVTHPVSDFLLSANNFSDLSSPVTARTNLGLGSSATHPTTDFVLASAVGAAAGVASLDGGGKLSSSQIPASLVGALQYQGTWNASTNIPVLASSTGTKGQYYKVSVAGTTSLDGLSSWNVGDSVVFDGTVWDKIDGINNEVISVAGRTGVITITTSDVGGLGTLATLSAAPAGTLSGTTLNATVVTSSLTTVATIGAGVWQGTLIGPTYGGTGVNNGSSTITIGGNIAFSGAYTFAATLSANTAVTFPTSGLLLTSKSLYDNGSGGTTATVAFDNGNAQKMTLNAALCTITLTAPASGKPATMRMHFYNTSTYAITFTGLGSTVLCSGPLPVVTTGTAHDIWVIDYDGTNFYVANVLPGVG